MEKKIEAKSYERFTKEKDERGNPTDKWIAHTVFYYSIGQVRNLFAIASSYHTYKTELEVINPETGLAKLTGRLSYMLKDQEANLSNEIIIQTLLSLPDVVKIDKYGTDKTSEEYNKKNTALEKRLKVMALGLDDPEEEEQEKKEYESYSDQTEKVVVSQKSTASYNPEKPKAEKLLTDPIDNKKKGFVSAVIHQFDKKDKEAILSELAGSPDLTAWNEENYSHFMSVLRSLLNQPKGLIKFSITDEKTGEELLNPVLLKYFTDILERAEA